MMDKLDLEGLAWVGPMLIAERQDDPKFTATAEALLQFIAELRDAREIIKLADSVRSFMPQGIIEKLERYDEDYGI